MERENSASETCLEDIAWDVGFTYLPLWKNDRIFISANKPEFSMCQHSHHLWFQEVIADLKMSTYQHKIGKADES